jgi:DNA-binding transcriptional LysR family regulator
MDRLDELAVFVAVLEAGGLAAAARRLRRSPPAVTRILAALEARLGVRLVERTTRRVAATEAGRALAAQARALLAQYGEAVQQASGARDAASGTLRVTAPVVFGRLHVTPLVAGFLALHPGMRVELQLSDRTLDLLEEELDAAIRIGPLDDSGLVVRRVGEVTRQLVASPAYLARHGAPATPAALAAHELIQATGRGAVPEWRFRERGRTRKLRLAARLLVNDVEASLAAARAGYGIASALSYQVAGDLASGRLVRLLPGFEPPALPVHLVVPSARLMPLRLRRFLDHAAAVLGAEPALHPVRRDAGLSPRYADASHTGETPP